MRLVGPALAFVFGVTAAGCGESQSPAGPKAPRTAAARARAEHEAEEGKVPDKGKKWGGWRYQGSRDDCFFLVKRKCFTKRADACAAAKCGKKECVIEGGGPATVSCE